MENRLTDKDQKPTASDVVALIGVENYKRWVRLVEFIDSKYPGVFAGEWLYGGRKHGWALRFKKSKSFCTLIPERTHLP